MLSVYSKFRAKVLDFFFLVVLGLVFQYFMELSFDQYNWDDLVLFYLFRFLGGEFGDVFMVKE